MFKSGKAKIVKTERGEVLFYLEDDDEQLKRHQVVWIDGGTLNVQCMGSYEEMQAGFDRADENYANGLLDRVQKLLEEED